MSFSAGNLNQNQNKKIKLDFILHDFIDLLELMKSKVEDA
jgi:hypothetical protein